MKRFGLAWLVAKRELIDQMRDWRILVPMIILTFFFPYLMTVAARQTVDYINRYGASLIAERLLPFLILVVGFFPVTVSLVVALEAFVGEKERGTIEPLLTSPLEDWHLYVGKLMAGTIVPLVVSYFGIALYMGGLWWQNIPWPEWGFTIQTLALTAVQTLLMVSAAIVISTQSTSVRAANLLASFIVIPVALLIQGESAMMFWGTNDVLWLAVIGVAVMSALTVRLGLAHFRRESLLGREIDMLNIGWLWNLFYREFSGGDEPPATTRYLSSVFKRLLRRRNSEQSSLSQTLWADWQGLKRWYRVDVLASLRQIVPSLCITVFLAIAAVIATYLYVDNILPAATLPDEQLHDAVKSIRSLLMDDGGAQLSAGTLFWHNLRAELVILVLGFFSFGVLSTVVLSGNFGLIGGVLGMTRLVGVSPLTVFLAGILPHGILELPSVILISAAIFHVGLRMVTPDRNRTIGESMIVALADTFKILFALCIPLLVLAALIEANITPRILLAVLGHELDL